MSFDLASDFIEPHEYATLDAWNALWDSLWYSCHKNSCLHDALWDSRCKNSCLQECIVGLARGKWRNRLRRMLSYAFSNDSRSGLNGSSQEEMNFNLTETILCLSQFKVEVVEARTMEELLAGCCKRAWTLGPASQSPHVHETADH